MAAARSSLPNAVAAVVLVALGFGVGWVLRGAPSAEQPVAGDGTEAPVGASGRTAKSPPRTGPDLPPSTSPSATRDPAGVGPEGEPVQVVRVVDGDTLEVRTGQVVERVRLDGIDAPERGQPFSRVATRRLREIVSDGAVRLDRHGEDRYDRTIGELMLVDGTSVNRVLVAEGLAWHYKRYSKDAELASLEVEARRHGLGLWRDGEPIPPWDWRKRGRKKRSANATHERGGPNEIGSVRGNRRSKVFHLPGCPSFDRVSTKNRVPFKNTDDAVAAGYRRAGNCP